MTPKEERFWDGMSKLVGNTMMAGVICVLCFVALARVVEEPLYVTGPHTIRGVFLEATQPVNMTGGYILLGEDGRKYHFTCDRAHMGRGPTPNFCLSSTPVQPVPELAGRPVEVRYLLTRSRYDRPKSSPGRIVLSVRDGGVVLATNSVKLKVAGP